MAIALPNEKGTDTEPLAAPATATKPVVPQAPAAKPASGLPLGDVAAQPAGQAPLAGAATGLQNAQANSPDPMAFTGGDLMASGPQFGMMTPGPATDIGGAAPGAAPMLPPAPAAGAGVGLSAINADNSLLGQQITPNNSVDRVKTFQDALNSTIHNVIDPAYDTSARDLNRYNFGAGRGVSGAARTSQGDLAAQRERGIRDLAAQGLAGATTGSIEDLYRNLGIEQQQQGFQKSLSDTAFNQALASAGLTDQLTNSAANRAAQQETIGELNNPASIEQWLSQNFGQQAGDAQSAAAQLFGGIGARNGTNAGSAGGLDVASILRMLGIGQGTDNNVPYVDSPLPGGDAGVYG